MITHVSEHETLDIEIAVRVMGRTLPTQHEMEQEAEKVWATQPQCRVFLRGFIAVERTDPVTLCRDGFTFKPQVRAYSTDPEAALQVVERLAPRHPLSLSTIMTGGKLAYFASFGVAPRACGLPTFPLAVCRFIEWRGEYHALGVWARKLDINYDTLHSRLHVLGWSVERAFTDSCKKLD